MFATNASSTSSPSYAHRGVLVSIVLGVALLQSCPLSQRPAAKGAATRLVCGVPFTYGHLATAQDDGPGQKIKARVKVTIACEVPSHVAVVGSRGPADAIFSPI